MTDERDPQIQGALRQVRVPQHRDGFWDDLDAQLDDNVVVMRPRRGRWLLVAAAALVMLSLGVALERRGEEKRGIVAANQPGTTSTTPPTAVAHGTGTPEQAVLDWIDALAEGDVAAAADLMGPRTKRYITSLGGTPEGFATEAQEGYGAWADSPDRSTTEVELPVSSQGIVIVVVSGTWTGEGDTEYRFDALPVVIENGRWLVEPSAFRSDTGGRLEIDKSETAVVATAPGDGGFFFSLNDGDVKAVAGEGSGSSRRATFALDGLPRQTHLLVVAYVDGDTVTALATTIKR